MKNLFFALDCDDTTVNTTKDLKGDLGNLARLTSVPGAREFLEKWGKQTWVISIGKEEDQLSKFQQVGLIHLVGLFCIVSTPQQKEEMFCRLASSQNGSFPPHIVGVGDRLDHDICPGKRAGLTMVRMRLPEGKYAHDEPASATEIPDYTVSDFYQLQRLPIFL